MRQEGEDCFMRNFLEYWPFVQMHCMGEKCPLEVEEGTVTTEFTVAMNLEISVVCYYHLEIAQL